MATLVAKDEGELESIVRTLLVALKEKGEAHVLALHGDLGAGKTAFTKALARVLQVREHVTSPTFVIMKSYDISAHERFTTLTHIDAYRIEDESELTVLGFENLLSDTSRLIVIEWPERIPGLMPEDALTVNITIGEGNERIITYGE
jgi:tRNA threonylcarbamoyladenosine biosynthesis protein TsaE